MGTILDQTPEMGEYSVEVRRESFYLRGEASHEGKGEHAIYVYETNASGRGSVEIITADISKIRAALDAVERFVRERGD
jgi:hypothetical protein